MANSKNHPTFGKKNLLCAKATGARGQKSECVASGYGMRMRMLIASTICFLLVICCVIFTGCSGDNSSDSGDAVLKQSGISADSDVLIAYFSATGNTKTAAQYAQSAVSEIAASADLFEIEPVDPYTSDDLAYEDQSSRAMVESEDLSILPEIADKVENMAQYDVVLLGYPIWFGKAPNIMYSFLAEYELSGITIVPFCTSSSSGIGTSAEELATVTPGAIWLPGMRFPSDVYAEEVTSWVDSLRVDA